MTKLIGGQSPATERADKIMLLAHGFPGVGKTAFALSFPAPFWVFNLDRAIGALSTKLPEGHLLDYEAVAIDVDSPTKATAVQYLTRFDKLLNRALTGQILDDDGTVITVPKDGTFILDGSDIFWDIVKIAKVNNLDSDLPKEYAPANAYMNGVLGRLGRSSLNVVFSTISSKVWTGAKTESDRVRANGFKHKDRMLTHEVYMFTPEDRRNPQEVPKGGDAATPGSTGQTHRAIITMSKLNESLINRVMPNLNFGLLYRLTFGMAYPEPERLWSPSAAATAAAKVEVSNA